MNSRIQYAFTACMIMIILVALNAACNTQSIQNFGFMNADYQCSSLLFENISESTLHDKLSSFAHDSARTGIKPYRKTSELLRYAPKNRRLVAINNNHLYSISNLSHSYPYLTREASGTLDNIAELFQSNLIDTPLSSMRIEVTSMLRSEETQKSLRKVNSNATSNINPPHTHGTSFDISYTTFANQYGYHVPVSSCQRRYLRSVLAKSLIQTQKNDDRVYIIKETRQSCFHVSVCKREKLKY